MPLSRFLLLPFVVCAALSCGGAAAPTHAPNEAPKGPSHPALAAVATTGAQSFQAFPDEAFWVTHDAVEDRVVSAGSRLVLDRRGRITRSAWRASLEGPEALVGSLALAPHLGGGFLHWSASRLFRSDAFTGPLREVVIPPSLRAGLGVRGARNGLASALVITTAGPLEVLPRSDEARSASDPGLLDLAALGPQVAARLDVFGRASTTRDAGRTWRDVSPLLGGAARALYVSSEGVAIDTAQRRFVVEPDASLSEPERPLRPSIDLATAFRTFFLGSRAYGGEPASSSNRELSPLQAAVLAGARAKDGTLWAPLAGAFARVDGATGEVLGQYGDAPPMSLVCQAIGESGAVLLACARDRYESYGAVVLVSKRGEAPSLERSLSADGVFVSDDRGGLGYVGGCDDAPRLVDPEANDRADPSVYSPLFCVRRGPGDWVERRVSLGPSEAILAWVPRRDGGATVVVANRYDDGRIAAQSPLRSASSPLRESGGVRVIAVAEDPEGAVFPSIEARIATGKSSILDVDRGFASNDDGSVTGWVQVASSTSSPIVAGATIDTEGRVFVHPLPPDVVATVATGEDGLAIARDGHLFETRDRGASWQRRGISPVGPSSFVGGCSRLGCALGPVVRLGWGDDSAASRIDEVSALGDDPPNPRAPVLACTPVDPPRIAADRGRRRGRMIATGYGDHIEVAVGDDDPDEAAQSLRFRAPFEPFSQPQVVPVSGKDAQTATRAMVTPLLGEEGDVSLLVVGPQRELLLGAAGANWFDAYEPRRYLYADGSPSTGLDRGALGAWVLASPRRLTTLEVHGVTPSPLPLSVAVERATLGTRMLTLARRDDGAAAVLVLDGAAPSTAGASIIDPVTAVLSPPAPLAAFATLTTADDPACKAQKGALQALIRIDPSAWVTLDPSELPGVALSHEGMILVRWGAERVCLEGAHFAATDALRPRASMGRVSLVARWGRRAGASAALRSDELTQRLTCAIVSPSR